MYVNQIQHINSEFLKIFDEIIKSSNIKPIIIVHSDHGIHNFSGSIGEEKLNDTSEAIIDEHFNILTSLILSPIFGIVNSTNFIIHKR